MTSPIFSLMGLRTAMNNYKLLKKKKRHTIKLSSKVVEIVEVMNVLIHKKRNMIQI